MWAETETGRLFAFHHEIRQALPNVGFPATMTDAMLAPFGFVPVTILPQPVYDPNTHTCILKPVPELVDGEWVLGWEEPVPINPNI